MDILGYFSSNVPLFSVSAVIILLAVRNIRIRKQESILFLVFTSIVLVLSIFVALEQFNTRCGNVVAATIFTSLGYITRLILLYIFVVLANLSEIRNKKFYLFLGIPLIVNFIVYMFPLFFNVEGLAKLVFYYEPAADGSAKFVRGTFLNFTSHFLCILYLIVLMYLSAIRFKGKHWKDGLVLVLCVGIIIITVATEMIAERDDLLNIVCEICLLINYIFIMTINTSKDPLTSLYDRRTYYEDISRYKDHVNGVVSIDMNGLKYLNDNKGHESGDKGLITIASILQSVSNPSSMCVYRLSGDEFLILMFDGIHELLSKTVALIKQRMAKSPYSAAMGMYYFTKEDNITLQEALKKAEELMYQDKAAYYKQSGHDRRIAQK